MAMEIAASDRRWRRTDVMTESIEAGAINRFRGRYFFASRERPGAIHRLRQLEGRMRDVTGDTGTLAFAGVSPLLHKIGVEV